MARFMGKQNPIRSSGNSCFGYDSTDKSSTTVRNRPKPLLLCRLLPTIFYRGFPTVVAPLSHSPSTPPMPGAWRLLLFFASSSHPPV